MANSNGSIDEIIGQEAIKGVDVTIQKLERLESVFISLTKNVKTLDAQLSSTTSIKEKTAAISKLSTETNKLEVITVKTKEETAKLNVLRQQETAALKTNAQIVTSATGSYAQQEAQMKKLVVQYKALSAEQRNGALGQGLQKQIASINTELKGLDAGLGNMQRNVGNYGAAITSAFSKVWSVLRTAANIIPGLGISGMFLAMYEGGKLAAESMGLLTSQTKEQIEATNKLRDAFDNAVSGGAKEVSMLKNIYDRTQDVTLSIGERRKAVDELQKQYPDYFKNIKDETILAGKARDVYLELSQALYDTVINRAYQTQAAEMGKDMIKQQMMLDELIAQRQARMKNGSGEMKFDSRGQAVGIEEDQAAYKKLLEDMANVPGIGKDLVNKLLQSGQSSVYLALNTVINDISEAVSTTESKIQGLLDYANRNYGSQLRGGTSTAASATSNRKDNSLKEAEDLKKRLEKLDEEYTRYAIWLNDYLVKLDHDKYIEMQKAKNNFNVFVTKSDEDEIKSDEAKNKAFIKNTVDTIEAQKELEKKQRDERLKNTESEIQSLLSIAMTIEESIAAKKMQELDARDKALKASYDNELRFIEQSGMSSSKKEKEKQKLQAETEAKQKQIDRDRITALRKAATIQKAIDIATIIAKTAIAVMADLAIPIYGEAKAIATAAAGAANLAAVIATPLPQYYKGRKGGKAEWAETNEYGAELHVTKDGKAYIPNQGLRGATFLDEGTSVLPADITREIMKSTYVSLSDGSKVTTDRMQAAMLDKLDGILFENQQLRKALIDKEFSSNYVDLSAYRSYKASHIK